MQLDREPYAYGTTILADWWAAPIDFINYLDATGRRVNNFSRHHRGDLEILHEWIVGATAEDKLYALAEAAIDGQPPSPSSTFSRTITSTTSKSPPSARPQPKSLLQLLQGYAVSTLFHSRSTFKYRTAFQRKMTIYNSDGVLYVFTTDFGRQLKANGDFGTDHGSGNYMILVGHGVNGGTYGEMFPESEITGGVGPTRYDQQGSDIEGRPRLNTSSKASFRVVLQIEQGSDSKRVSLQSSPRGAPPNSPTGSIPAA